MTEEVEPICLPSAVDPWLVSVPVARTADTAFHPAVVVGAVSEKVVPSVEYEIVHPVGAMMSLTDCNLTFVGSIVCVIVCVDCPA